MEQWLEKQGFKVVKSGGDLHVEGNVFNAWEPRGAGRWPLSALFGLTMATNGIEGGTALFTLAVSVAFALWGVRRRSAVLTTAWVVTAALLTGWGLYWAVTDGRFFPQFSELGWI